MVPGVLYERMKFEGWLKSPPPLHSLSYLLCITWSTHQENNTKTHKNNPQTPPPTKKIKKVGVTGKNTKQKDPGAWKQSFQFLQEQSDAISNPPPQRYVQRRSFVSAGKKRRKAPIGSFGCSLPSVSFGIF